ncbi:MAG: hypothetical protein HGA31_06785 [Candidatus Moranbacteria bacterium]|nr:hypothetical protein [Candidatus Moranbacteria bacterium]
MKAFNPLEHFQAAEKLKAVDDRHPDVQEVPASIVGADVVSDRPLVSDVSVDERHLVEILRNQGVDFGKYGLDGLDWDELHGIPDLDSRLDAALATSVGETNEPAFYDALSRVMAKTGITKLVAGLSLIGLMSSCSPKKSPDIAPVGMKNEYGQKLEKGGKIDPKFEFINRLKFPDREAGTEKKLEAEDILKMIVEPFSGAVGYRELVEETISVSVPYEYSRTFDQGKPVDEHDAERRDRYIRERMMEELKSGIIAFAWDKDDLAKERPDMVDVQDMEILGISVVGSASPEAVRKGSEQVGKIDSENERLAHLRAENAVRSIVAVLDELGIPYAEDQITIESVEKQFSEPEIDALEKLAHGKGVEIFDLLQEYNKGRIDDAHQKEMLDAIVGSKRNTVVIMRMKGEAPRALVIPLPLLLLLVPLLRKFGIKMRDKLATGNRDVDGEYGSAGRSDLIDSRVVQAERVITTRKKITLTSFPKIEWADGKTFSIPVPAFRLAEKEVNIPYPIFNAVPMKFTFERGVKPVDKIDDIIANVGLDIQHSFDLYFRLAVAHANDENLSDEKESISVIASDMLVIWESTWSDEKRREMGDIFQNQNEVFYAELHAWVVRRISIDMKNGVIPPINDAKRLRELIFKLTGDELERYRQKG